MVELQPRIFKKLPAAGMDYLVVYPQIRPKPTNRLMKQIFCRAGYHDDQRKLVVACERGDACEGQRLSTLNVAECQPGFSPRRSSGRKALAQNRNRLPFDC